MGCFIFIMIMITSQLYATTYYVDATNGNDDNSGTSPGSAWKTIAKVNDSFFNPGDSILFKKGEIWRERLSPASSGSSVTPITFASYGIGNKPIINGADLINNWSAEGSNKWSALCSTEPKLNVFFNGTKGTKKSSKANLSSEHDWYWESNTLYVYSTYDPNIAYTNPGIEVPTRDDCITLSSDNYITIDGFDLKYANCVNTWNAGIYIGNGTGITIKNCTIQYCARRAINISDTASGNIIIDNCDIHHNGSMGFNEGGIRVRGSQVEIKNCFIYDNYTVSVNEDACGILLASGSSDCKVHHNIIYDNGNAINGEAIGLYNSNGNSIYCNRLSGSELAIEVNNSADNNEIYYNIFFGTLGNATICVSTVEGCSTGNKFYNNTIDCNGKSGIENYCSGNTYKNNIIYNISSSSYAIYQGNANYSTMDYNCYEPNDSGYIIWDNGNLCDLANWQASSGQDTNSIALDPLFVDEKNHNYTLRPDSFCINNGVDVKLTEDYVGTPVPQGPSPDIGAYEYQGNVTPLSAEINASPTSGYVPLSVSFTGNANGGTSPYSYSWDFGDGSTSTAQNPPHTYSSTGSYTVTLTVTDSNSSTATDSLTITVTSPPPPLSASASASTISGEVPLTVNFTGSATGGTSPYSYSWNFGDSQSSSSQNPSHTFNSSGNYTITLTVTDSASSTATDSLTITATSPPAAEVSLSISSLTGSPAPGSGGTTDPSPGSHSYAVGSSVQVKAEANTDYRFAKWSGDVSSSDFYNAQIAIIMDKYKSISAYFYTKCGDVNGDLNITPADAQAAFDIFLGKIPNPTESELENADVNCDGTKTTPNVTPADAQAIFDKFLGKSNLPCSCSAASRASTLSGIIKQASNINLIINDIEASQGQEIVVPVIVDDAFNIKSFGFDFIFPSEALEFVGVERGKSQEEFDKLDANMIAEGIVRAGGYKNVPVSEHKPLVLINLVFRVIGSTNKPIPLAIVNTVDDIRNAPVIKGKYTKEIKRPKYVR
ncbi:MAG: PKD domain-containing protein [Candidatus Helarchaeota archaeon]